MFHCSCLVLWDPKVRAWCRSWRLWRCLYGRSGHWWDRLCVHWHHLLCRSFRGLCEKTELSRKCRWNPQSVKSMHWILASIERRGRYRACLFPDKNWLMWLRWEFGTSLRFIYFMTTKLLHGQGFTRLQGGMHYPIEGHKGALWAANANNSSYREYQQNACHSRSWRLDWTTYCAAVKRLYVCGETCIPRDSTNTSVKSI